MESFVLLRSVGNATVITVPQAALRVLGWQRGDRVKVTTDPESGSFQVEVSEPGFRGARIGVGGLEDVENDAASGLSPTAATIGEG